MNAQLSMEGEGKGLQLLKQIWLKMDAPLSGRLGFLCHAVMSTNIKFAKLSTLKEFRKFLNFYSFFITSEGCLSLCKTTLMKKTKWWKNEPGFSRTL